MKYISIQMALGRGLGQGLGLELDSNLLCSVFYYSLYFMTVPSFSSFSATLLHFPSLSFIFQHSTSSSFTRLHLPPLAFIFHQTPLSSTTLRHLSPLSFIFRHFCSLFYGHAEAKVLVNIWKALNESGWRGSFCWPG